jgi:hypothetical protein
MSTRLVRLAVVLVMAGCGETLDLVPDDMGVGLQNGESCDTSTACTSGFCVDHLCCDTACNGVCEACDVAGSKGTCAAVPADTDPAMECSAMSLSGPDGGTPLPYIDGGINTPDGGFIAMDAPCGGACDGARACKYPGKEKSCGESFCNDASLQLSFACNGTGSCTLQPTTCNAYACTTSACATSCTSQSDCLPDHFCNGSGQCVPKHDNSVQCNLGYECNSGFCAGDSSNPSSAKVCCDTACTNAIPGATCINPGAEGHCECSKGCTGAQGSCVLSYPDADGDGFGNPLGATTVECSMALPPGRVIDNTDCYDANPHAYPGPRKAGDQHCSTSGTFTCCYNNWFFTDRGDGSYDYDCDGVETHQVNEWPNGTVCHFCDYGDGCSSSDTMCASSGEYATMAACGAPATCTVPFTRNVCGSCYFFAYICAVEQPTNTGFVGKVACGAKGNRYDCGQCGTLNGGPSYTDPLTQQGCL